MKRKTISERAHTCKLRLLGELRPDASLGSFEGRIAIVRAYKAGYRAAKREGRKAK